MNAPRQHIVILGGGFGGIRLAQRLSRQRLPVDITLIDQEAYQTYTPSLYEVVCGRHPRLVCFSIAEALARTEVHFIHGTVQTLNLRSQRVTLDHGQAIDYDQLVIALGMVTNDYGIPGVKEYAFPLKSVADAWSLRQHLESEYRAAQSESRSLAGRKLRFVVAGGGPTGVELAAGLAEFRRHLSGEFGIDPQLTTIEICEAGQEILGGRDQQLIQSVRRRLAKLDVTIKVKSPILHDEVRAVVIGQDRELTETLIWTAGTKVSPLIEDVAGLQHLKNGRVVVDGYLRAHPFENVWVIGDLAGTSDAGTAQIALRQAEAVADNLMQQLVGRAMSHYEPSSPIVVMPLGAGYAVVRIGRWLIRGWLGMVIRQLADLRYLVSLFPLAEAFNTWLVGHRPCPDCRKQLAEMLKNSFQGVRQP